MRTLWRILARLYQRRSMALYRRALRLQTVSEKFSLRSKGLR